MDILEKLNIILTEAVKATIRCMECGNKFKKKIGPKTTEIRCPKCGSYDTEIE